MMTTTLPAVVPGLFIALGLGFVLQPLVLRLMIRAAVLDTPCERSSHTTVTPRGGGIAVVAAAAAALAMTPSARVFAVPLLLFAAIGLVEDLRGVSVPARLALQLAAAAATVILVQPGHRTAVAGIAVVAVGTVWLTGYTNAFNFMDGVNGIATAHTILGGLVYAVIGSLYAVPAMTAAGVVIAAAASTFLPWNAGRARIFLGDVGAYGLGGMLGALAIYGITRGVAVEAAAAPLVLYLTDTGWTLVRRMSQGEVWYRAHRTHVYQRLTDVGWSHQRVAVVTATISAAMCACLLTAPHTDPPLRAMVDALAAAIAVGYLALPGWLTPRARVRRQRGRSYA